jgi:uncharacterized protein YbaP (TraB family)
MIRICLVICLLLFNRFQGHAQQWEKKYPSLLWEISGGGLSKPSYLYGTRHVSEKLAFNLSDTFYVALQNVDMVALELNPDTWLKESMDFEQARYMTEFTNSYSRPSSFYKKAFKLSIPDEKDLKRFLKSSPDVINQMLYRTSNSRGDFEEDTYLDLYIFQAGKKLNKKVLGLEDFKRSREMVHQSELCVEDTEDKELREQQRMKLRELQGNKSYTEISEYAYRMGDLDLIDSLFTLTETTPCFRQHMLNDRNIVMANRMDSLMKQNSLFTGVGAAHLAGKDGVIELLRRKGYKVRPVSYTNGFGNKMVKKLEDLRYPVQFRPNQSADSAFSVSVPGALSELSDAGAAKSYLFNDMANGSYYYIRRINYFGGITRETVSAVMTRVDSLVFENIPGKVLTRKSIRSKNGFPGFDIVNKTRRGDVQRQQIFFTPEEIYIFKMSGTGEYVQKGTETDQYFNSINFKSTRNGQDKEYSPLSGEYTVTIPGASNIYHSSNPLALQKEIITASQPDKNGYFLFISSSLCDLRYIEEDTFELNFLAETFARQIKFKLTSRSVLHSGKYPSLDAVFTNDSNETVYSRIILRAQNYYLVSVKTGDKNYAEKYLNSLRFSPARYVRPYETYVDTLLHFSVKTQLNPSPFKDLVRPYTRPSSDGYSYKTEKKTKKEEKAFLPIDNSSVYVSNETGEKIFVEFRKFSMYYQVATMNEFWQDMVDELSKDRGMVASRVKKEEHGGMRQLTLLVTDTNSARGYLVKMIQKCGSLYTLKTYVDTTEAPGLFVDKFFESFTPQDTCIGVDVLSDKLTDHFFNKLYAPGELDRKLAENAIDYVRKNVKASHAPLLMQAIQNPDFKKLELKTKTILIRTLGTLDSKEILPFLEKLYDKYPDSLNLELAILRAVANQRSVLSTTYFMKMLRSELPVSRGSDDIYGIFYPYLDTLQVAKSLFPALLAYAKYPDYSGPVYQLLNDCVAKGVMTPKDYKHYKSDMLNDARYDLKLNMSAIENSGNDSYSYSGNDNIATSGNGDALSVLTGEQMKIYWYVNLLSPFYNRDPDIKKYIDKTLRGKQDLLTVFEVSTLLKNKISLPDSVWSALAAGDQTRFWLYRTLCTDKRLDKFDSKRYDQESVVASMLYGKRYEKKKDTLALISRLPASTGKKQGWVYVFKSRPLDKKIWKMSYLGIMPSEEGKLNFKPEVEEHSYSFESEKQLKKELDDMYKSLRIDGRKRASLSDFEDKGYSWQRDYEDY